MYYILFEFMVKIYVVAHFKFFVKTREYPWILTKYADICTDMEWIFIQQVAVSSVINIG